MANAVRLHAPAAEVRRHVSSRMARVEDDAPGWSILTAGADDLKWLAMRLALLDLEIEVLEPPELRGAAAELAGRLVGMST